MPTDHVAFSLLDRPYLSDVLWLMTAGDQVRRRPPRSVLEGVAGAAVVDLERVGEVSWSDFGATATATATLTVRDECRCEDGTLARWHGLLRDDTAGHPLEARFALAPLVPVAWSDVAGRLVADGLVALTGTRRRRDPQFGVVDTGSVREARRRLDAALTASRCDDRQHDLVVVAWATGCFDDLFAVTGWEARPALQDAARAETLEDVTHDRLEAAVGFGRLPFPTR